jgi:hypothetical protein
MKEEVGQVFLADHTLLIPANPFCRAIGYY